MFADFLQLLLFPLMLNVNERMGIDMLGSGQLGAVSVCVYGGAVCYWQTTTLHQRKVGGRCWLESTTQDRESDGTQQPAGESCTAEQGLEQLSNT